jgi:prepilin-type N-terminal cleavage/methylation domain-containing protein
VSRLRSQRGFTLIELMIVMSLALVILSATLTSFTNYYRSQKRSQNLNDSAQVARNAMDYASRQLRNLANQDPTQQTTTIARALPFDLVFQTSDPSRKWVRYCLDTAGAGLAGAPVGVVPIRPAGEPPLGLAVVGAPGADATVLAAVAAVTPPR